jgi:peptidylprolyl isomerase
VPNQKNRQWVSSRAKAAAIAAIGAGVLVIALIGGIALAGGGSSSKTSAASSAANLGTVASSTTSTSAPASVAGQPCVAVSDPLPAGAPDVPVKVGPPPAALVTEDLKPGDGAVVTAGQTLSVNYIGVSCSTGKIFDSSYSRGQPASFALSGVIQGWQDGIPGMKVGGQRLLGIPPSLGYGDRGQGAIAPGETLWFVVDVLTAT